ncbi:MAG: DnaB-like helicase N-terminal domain-containing protein, partial [Terracidiphilus sp.]
MKTDPNPAMEARPLPHNLDAERAVLGAILLDGTVPSKALSAAQQAICGTDFFLDAHRRIFRVMAELGETGRPVDLVTLSEYLDSKRELEAAGGPAYLIGLMDGLPRAANVRHYANIVAEKAALRRIAHAAHAVAETALEPGTTAAGIQEKLAGLLALAPRTNAPGLRTVTANELLALELPPREMILDPVLAAQSLAMIYSKRGVGKTFIALSMAHAVAKGAAFLRWNAPKPRRVLFIDGELPVTVLRERLSSIVRDCELLRIITPDLQGAAMPDLSSAVGQALVEARLNGDELI